MRSRGQATADPESVIVQYPDPDRRDQEIVRLAPGEDATFGRGGPGHPVRLRIDHPGVGRLAGRITAAQDHWLLSNLSIDRTYLVENPEGAGEHVKVAPRRLDAPIPFELARVALPVDPAPLAFVVFAPPPRLADHSAPSTPDGATTALFSLDETAKYFLVLIALCEPRLRDGSSVALPTDPQILDRLRLLPSCRHLTRSAVNFHLDYLARSKLRLRQPGAAEHPRVAGRRAALASFALRFDLVREEHLDLLPSAREPTG
jgi:hypothetical protein